MERSLAFYRDGMGLEIQGIIGKEKLEIVLSSSVSVFTPEFRSGRRGGRKGVWEIPLASPSDFGSDIFKQTPLLHISRSIGRCGLV